MENEEKMGQRQQYRGLYASNVFHYNHVVTALQGLCDDVTLVRRFEVSPRQADRVRLAPRRVRELVARRVVDQPRDVAVSGLGAAQFLLPFSARIPVVDPSVTYRVSVRQQSRAVARAASRVRPDLFQFTECLGVETLRAGLAGVAICERRHLHHEALEGDPGAVGDFPHLDKPDPVADILSEEYERSDLIVVYSEVARRSFLDRGFDPSRVVVTPLGISLPAALEGRSRRRHRIAYVGRTDAYKGIDIAVAAIGLLGRPYELHVAGPASRRVQDWLATKPWVTYHGILARPSLDELYATSSVLLAPSIESFGYAAMEGAALGAHLVCADTTGAAEFLPPESCTVGSGRDPEAWASWVETASCEDSEAGGHRTETVRAALAALSWDAVAPHTSAALHAAQALGAGDAR